VQRDDAVKARFEECVKLKTTDDPNRQRALRYIRRPELVRARMAPPFGSRQPMARKSLSTICRAGVILSVSLDRDELKWKEFITQNEMSWPLYRDGGFEGSVAKLFGAKAIPHTFAIDHHRRRRRPSGRAHRRCFHRCETVRQPTARFDAFLFAIPSQTRTTQGTRTESPHRMDSLDRRRVVPAKTFR
jgi:hypothetical protein